MAALVPGWRLLAFFSRRDTRGEDDEVYLWDPVVEATQRVTDRPGHDYCPAWSPDGYGSLWRSSGPGEERSLRITDLEGNELAVLAENFARVNQPSWSPDGRGIVFRAADGGRGLRSLPGRGAGVGRTLPATRAHERDLAQHRIPLFRTPHRARAVVARVVNRLEFTRVAVVLSPGRARAPGAPRNLATGHARRPGDRCRLHRFFGLHQ